MFVEVKGDKCVVVRPPCLPEDEGNWQLLAVCDSRLAVAEFVKRYLEIAEGFYSVDDLVYICSEFSPAAGWVPDELRQFIPRNIKDFLAASSVVPESGSGSGTRVADESLTDDEAPVCDGCGRQLTWHEGAFSGFVHSDNFTENKRLSAECKRNSDLSPTAGMDQLIRTEAAARELDRNPPPADPEAGTRVADDFDEMMAAVKRTEAERAADRERREYGTPGTLLRHPLDD